MPTYELRQEAYYSIKNGQAACWVAFAALPPDFQGQRLRQWRITSPSASVQRVQTNERSGDRYLCLAFPALDEAQHAELRFTLEMVVEFSGRTRDRGNLPAPYARPRPLDREHSTDYFDFHLPAFTSWVRDNALSRERGEPTGSYAERIGGQLRGVLRAMDTQGVSALTTCQRGGGTCAGLSSVFVSLMRAHGIPARSLVGRFCVSGNRGSKHVRPQFYDEKTGWHTLDITFLISGSKSYAQNLDRQDDFLVQYLYPRIQVHSPVLEPQPEVPSLQETYASYTALRGTPQWDEVFDSWEAKRIG